MIESNQTKQLTLMELSNINGGNFPYGWYSPFHIISNNILCRNGYSYNKTNPDNDKRIIDWANIAGKVANNIGASLGDLHNPLP